MSNTPDILTAHPDTPCADCGTPVHWLEMFPANRCVDCHAHATRHDIVTADDIRAAFGGRRTRR